MKKYKFEATPTPYAYSRRKLIKEHIPKPYKQSVIRLCKDNIDRFIRPEWHRDFRKSHVKRIMGSLYQGIHFSENITVNFKNKNYRIVNGNHRIAAVKQVIEKFPNFSIQATITSYEKLNLDDERKLYSLINRVKTESMDDYLKSHCHDSKIYKLIKENFPINIGFYAATKSTRNYINFGVLMKSYLQRNLTTSIQIGYKRAFLVKEIHKMGEKEYDRMRSFAEFFLDVWGEPSKLNPYATTGRILIFSKIYFAEITGIGPINLKKRFKELMVKKPHIFNEKVTTTDYTFYYKRLISELNKIRRYDRGHLFDMLIQKEEETKV